MIKKLISNYKKKSLNERFLLFIRGLFFLIYLTFGIIVILWERIPYLTIPKYRISFGILLIVYGFLRFYRFLNSNSQDD